MGHQDSRDQSETKSNVGGRGGGEYFEYKLEQKTFLGDFMVLLRAENF